MKKIYNGGLNQFNLRVSRNRCNFFTALPTRSTFPYKAKEQRLSHQNIWKRESCSSKLSWQKYYHMFSPKQKALFQKSIKVA